MLAAELAVARIDVAIVERRPNQEFAGSRAGGLHAPTIEVLGQRGVAERFLAEGKTMQVAGFALISLDISDAPTRHNYGLALFKNHIEDRRRGRPVDGRKRHSKPGVRHNAASTFQQPESLLDMWMD